MQNKLDVEVGQSMENAKCDMCGIITCDYAMQVMVADNTCVVNECLCSICFSNAMSGYIASRGRAPGEVMKETKKIVQVVKEAYEAKNKDTTIH